MHEGCNGNFATGREIVRKLRAMGFSAMALPQPLRLTCEACGQVFVMQTCEDRCSQCGLIYGVTPCHAQDPAAVRAAGPADALD